ncbi:killer toxin resistant protein [Vanrija albida]|uniref:Killer toxin resistant protein n=1 Tax=Vanrija albida TaxID=181172 RepID=A0ABR3QA31_9TREE
MFGDSDDDYNPLHRHQLGSTTMKETIYDERPEVYFPLLRLLSKHSLALGPDASAQDVLEQALNLIETHALLPLPSELSTFGLGLALHAAAPRIEASYASYAAVDEAALGVKACDAWVEWRGKGFCAVDDLRRDIELSIDDEAHVASETAYSPLPFDRASNPDARAHAIFYYSPSAAAVPLLEYLDAHAKAYPSFQYVVRYRPTAADRERTARTPLAGYGVEMALKNTDYLVVDDRAAGNGGNDAQAAFEAPSNSSSQPFAAVLGSDPWAEHATPLTAAEAKDLGLQAVALIKGAEDPLEAFVALSQDLPKYTAALARHVDVPANIRERAERLAVRHPIGPAFYLNGRLLKDADLTAFGLLNAIREERHYITSLLDLGFTPEQAFSLISDPLIGQAQAEDDPLDGIVDASDRLEGQPVITWLNDLETDRQYQQWPKDIRGYLRPMYPGQLHLISRNTWNIVIVVDLATLKGLDVILGSVTTLLGRSIPLHIGIVPMFDSVDETSGKIAKAFYYLDVNLGSATAREYLLNTARKSNGELVITETMAKDAYAKTLDNSDTSGELLSFADLQASPIVDKLIDANQKYAARLGATKETSASGHFFLNGKHTQLSQGWTQELQAGINAQLEHLQEAIASGYPIDPDTIGNYFYDLPTTATRRNKFITPSPGVNQLLSFNLLDVFKGQALTLLHEFIYPSKVENKAVPLTTWIVGDLDTKESRELMENALAHLQDKRCASRLGFVHVPTAGSAIPAGASRLSTLLYQLMSNTKLNEVTPEAFAELLKELDAIKGNVDEDGKIVADGLEGDSAEEGAPLNSFTSSGWSVTDHAAAAEFWKLGTSVATHLKLQSSQPHILINGRLIGPVTANDFKRADLQSLEQYELRKRVHPLITLLDTYLDDAEQMDPAAVANIFAVTSSVISASYMPQGAEGIFTPLRGARTRGYEQLDDDDISFAVGDPKTALLRAAVIIDPISEQAQKWSALLELLSDIEHVAINVYFDPNIAAKEVKVKRFYRSSLRSKLSFDVDGNEAAPLVTFEDMPPKPIYTLAMDVPGSWIVRPKESFLDLDNLLLGNLQEPTHVLFDLQQLVIDGHAREASNTPPRGLQLQLLDGDKIASDTQVMANLGYFQFKATPGVYQLAIRPGRGEEVFELTSAGADGWDSPTVNVSGIDIPLASFDGVTLYPRFTRRPGMEKADVLASKETSLASGFVDSVFGRMKEIVGLAPATTKPVSRHADINIFTVASGLLYERFASIMILSVMKHTKSTVKFWFIENFLSPTFINFLPHLAKEYGFDYELVTYKWPHWLREQTEKQRIIWAYKILFLDVLFPMDLDKVIFVDADQIVRVDMKELVDVDIKGHVYGYPPMGDDRQEMEGFRFWKTGYWKNELRGRPYHISALYVVDLKRFRQFAAGDRLRGQYHALSADPNSLANLDQDLPNSMQDVIPIFTLDQEWLWCQTWCSDESLARAKTIDLCQNPLTKEPKLVRARQIPEWDTYDREIAAFAASLESDAGALAANVDDLASGPVGGSGSVDKTKAGDKPKAAEDAPPAQEPEKNSGHIEDEL